MTAVSVVTEGSAVKLGATVASSKLSASTVEKLETAPLTHVSYESSLTDSIDHLRADIDQFLGHGE